jgi:peptidylprolyl isomerase
MARRFAARALFVLPLGAALVLGGCGGGGGDNPASDPPTVRTTAPTVRPPDPGPLKVTVNNQNDIHLRPNLVVNRGTLPTQLVTTDLIPGTGRTAGPGDTVTIQYVGVIARNGQEFDASWDPQPDGSVQPTTLSLAQTIPGFRNGIAGMKENGRREIIMPPDQAYGARGAGSSVGPNETLIFVVDLLKID